MENHLKLKIVLSYSLFKTRSYPDKKHKHESIDNQCIKQAVEASYILRYTASNKITVLLGLESFSFELKVKENPVTFLTF